MTVTQHSNTKEPPLFPAPLSSQTEQYDAGRKSTSRWPLLLLSNIALIAGIFAFAFGFFPYKPFLPGLSTFENGMEDVKAPFDKVVFMVVDALRRYI